MFRRPVCLAALLWIVACGSDAAPAGPNPPSAPADARADLLPGGIDAPAAATAGELITMHVGVRNAGALDAGPGWMVRVYLSTDATITAGDPLIDEFFTSRDLAGGRTDSYLRNKKLDGLLPTGTYYLGSIVDATGVVDETAESNNATPAPSTITITAAPITQ